ncbi:hypothetical protein [Xanthomonas vesicatoria]|uniref:hypothetical protein n=1 Tax=Xanthomonas vesicatoria TaxID=56460 RepID=UPI001E4A70C4|nr:hypothetical protein [Xanthomonas vesicatoria]MCC8628412.1 hypothetical protein [Xanthomonas vesicatoria]MDG4483535.1 hypothetical protein [Xanthomonas vesicatoria]
MDASAFTVKSVSDIAAGQLFYLSGGWWLKAVTPGNEPVHGAMCVIGPHQGRWDSNVRESVVTISDGWEWFADIYAPISPVAGMAPAGSVGLMAGTLLIIGSECAVRLDQATLQIVRGGVNAIHFMNWNAMIRKSGSGNKGDELFAVVGADG